MTMIFLSCDFFINHFDMHHTSYLHLAAGLKTFKRSCDIESLRGSARAGKSAQSNEDPNANADTCASETPVVNLHI